MTSKIFLKYAGQVPGAALAFQGPEFLISASTGAVWLPRGQRHREEGQTSHVARLGHLTPYS